MFSREQALSLHRSQILRFVSDTGSAKKPGGARHRAFRFYNAPGGSELHDEVALQNYVLAVPSNRILLA
jgi:hypothetical protein